MHRSPRGIARLLEAAACVVLARVLLATCAFSRLTPLVGEIGAALDGEPAPSAVRRSPASRVGQTIASAAARLPGNSSCLAQAIAGRLMLRRRRVSSQIVLGVNMVDGSLQAHAWLVAQGGIVCGGQTADRYVPLAAFGPQGRAAL
jgi:hypothetical protein